MTYTENEIRVAIANWVIMQGIKDRTGQAPSVAELIIILKSQTTK